MKILGQCQLKDLIVGCYPTLSVSVVLAPHKILYVVHQPYSLYFYPTLPYPTYPTIPYPTLTYPTLPYPTLPALPYPTLPYPTLPYQILPNIPFPSLHFPPDLPFTSIQLALFSCLIVSLQAIRGELSQFVDEMMITDSMVK